MDTPGKDTPKTLMHAEEALATRLALLFRDHGFQLLLVGGSVRDMLLGRETHDLDFATDALPEQTRQILSRAHPTALYAVGEKFGTIGATFDAIVVEITTFRSESYQPGSRKPEVRYGRSLVEDLARRDFTINAIARDVLTGALIDPFGGQHDLQQRLIRAVGDPIERFREDPLRIMRAVRFVAQFDFTLEARTRSAIPTCAELLRQVSRERI
ncbi:MAG TPA: RNA nucleotidyltransferase, partial [Chloroflexota bacterium]|nr:RNA nucleotidyltransferase [Chloroflexota bacterium]